MDRPGVKLAANLLRYRPLLAHESKPEIKRFKPAVMRLNGQQPTMGHITSFRDEQKRGYYTNSEVSG